MPFPLSEIKFSRACAGAWEGFGNASLTLKSIREEMKTLDQSAEVHDLEIRVGRLERKVSLKK
jgi:hypothetical protein